MSDFVDLALIGFVSSLAFPSLVFVPLFILHRLLSRLFGERVV